MQGINFRRFVVERALPLRLKGLVRNLPDGRSIEVHAEGAVEDLETLVRFLRRGPHGARVEGIDVEWTNYQGLYSDFTIGHS